MRIGNWVVFEKVPDVERLWEAVQHAEATLDRYRRSNQLLFSGRIEIVERQVAELQQILNQMFQERKMRDCNCTQLLQSCQELDRRLQRVEVFHADT